MVRRRFVATSSSWLMDVPTVDHFVFFWCDHCKYVFVSEQHDANFIGWIFGNCFEWQSLVWEFASLISAACRSMSTNISQGSVATRLGVIYQKCQWQNFENQLASGKVRGRQKYGSNFFRTQCRNVIQLTTVVWCMCCASSCDRRTRTIHDILHDPVTKRPVIRKPGSRSQVWCEPRSRSAVLRLNSWHDEILQQAWSNLHRPYRERETRGMQTRRECQWGTNMR